MAIVIVEIAQYCSYISALIVIIYLLEVPVKVWDNKYKSRTLNVQCIYNTFTRMCDI